MEDKVTKIARILELSSTETRDNALSSFIENVIFFFDNTPLSASDILEFVDGLFGVKPIESEVQNVISNLLSKGDILIAQNTYKLSDEKYLQTKKAALEAEESSDKRQERFNLLIREFGVISDIEAKELWKVFNEYLYDSFYQYGEYALTNFVQDNSENAGRLVNGSPYSSAIQKFNSSEMRSIFQRLVMVFVKKLSSEDISYLESLANKTLSFYSLGLPKDLHEEILDSQISWTILVDTNFLYSILDLHKNTETQACFELLKLVKELNLNVKFKYLPATINELKRKKPEFDEIIPRIAFTHQQIKALLSSNRLDSFSEIYYENLLNNSSTLHPSQIVDTSEKVITKAYGIELYNSKFEQISDDTLNHMISEYERYIQIKNEARREKGMFDDISKHPKQIWHDVLLREAVEYLQMKESSTQIQTFSEIKYLSVTLDKLLIDFDKYEIQKQNKIIPNFFKPSFLLQRIQKFSPIVTDNYKKAFITAISSFNFYDQNVKRSKDVQKFVSYYRSKGLNDEKILLNLITDDLFLDNFFKQDTNDDEFFESEISKKMDEIRRQNEEKEKEIQRLKERNSITGNEVKIVAKQVVEKESKISELDSILKETIEQSKFKEEQSNKVLIEQGIQLNIISEKLEKAENEKRYKEEIHSYENDKKEYIDNQWKEQVKYSNKLFEHIAIWALVPVSIIIVCYFESWSSMLKYVIAGVTSLVSLLLSYKNKDQFNFSRNYLWSRDKTEAKYKKDYKSKYEKENPRPTLSLNP